MPSKQPNKGKAKPGGKKEAGLTDKQELFCLEYLKCNFNAKEAYKTVYGLTNDNTAAVSASKMLTNANVIARIQALKAQKISRIEVSADKVMQEMAACGFYNALDYFKVVNRRVPVKEGDKVVRRVIQVVELREDISREAWAAVASIKQGPHGIELRFHDKTKNLELLGKHLDFFFVDRVDHTTQGQAITNAPDLSKLNGEEKLAYLRMLKKMRG